MHSVRWLAAAIVAVVLLSGCAGTNQLNMSKADGKIGSSLTTRYHLPVTDVSCPLKVTIHSGYTFQCTVHIDGLSLGVLVIQRSNRGDLGVEPTSAVLNMSSVETGVDKDLTSQLGRTISDAACGSPRIRVLATNAKFLCTVSDGHTAKQISVVVDDPDGSLTYNIG